MGMWISSYIFVLLLWTIKAAPLPPCPDGCTCNIIEDSKQELTCRTLNFFDNLDTSHISNIVALHLRDLNISKIDVRLKELHGLQKLDLANNRINNLTNFPYLPKLTSLNLNHNAIKDVTAKYLPKSLIDVHLSSNIITQIPENFLELKKLKNLYLKNNPISCTCDTIIVLNKLINNFGVAFPGRVECRTPREHSGKTWQEVECELTDYEVYDNMIGDDAGSGDGEDDSALTSTKVNIVTDDNNPNSNEIDEEYITDTNNNLPSSSDSPNDDEGSGDFIFNVNETTTESEEEGSGEEELIPRVVNKPLYKEPKACYFDCSSPPPIAANSSSPPPNIIDGAQIIIDDLTNKVKTEEPITETVTETIAIPQDKRTKIEQNPHEVDIIREDYKNSTHELERQLEQPNTKMSTTFIVVCGLLALMICLVIYSVYRRRVQRRKRLRENNKELEGKELMPMTKPPTEIPRIVEKTPLMNGQNGSNTNNIKPNEKDTLNEEDDVDYKPEDDVELRHKENDNLLTPQMERVTIQAKELSAPKTPILVNRHVSDDGNIITTPTNQL